MNRWLMGSSHAKCPIACIHVYKMFEGSCYFVNHLCNIMSQNKIGKALSHVIRTKTILVFIYLYNILSLSNLVRPCHPSVPSSVLSSIHPSSSSRKKMMMEQVEDDDSWQRHQFIQTF